MANVVIAIEFDLTALGARLSLERDGRHTVTGIFHAMDDLLRCAKARPPEVILVGDRLDLDSDVLSLVERLQAAVPRARLLVIGAAPNGRLIHDLFGCGISGYLYRGDPLMECLTSAVTATMKGRPYLSPTANAEYLVAIQSPEREWALDTEARQVLDLLAQGCHPGQIALELHIPLRRVYSVRRKLRRRFGVITNEHLISRAAAEGLISLEL